METHQTQLAAVALVGNLKKNKIKNKKKDGGRGRSCKCIKFRFHKTRREITEMLYHFFPVGFCLLVALLAEKTVSLPVCCDKRRLAQEINTSIRISSGIFFVCLFPFALMP